MPNYPLVFESCQKLSLIREYLKLDVKTFSSSTVHTLLRRGCLHDDNIVLFFPSSLNIHTEALRVVAAAIKNKQEELQRPHNICPFFSFSPFPHTAAASLRVRITHSFLPIGDIVWYSSQNSVLISCISQKRFRAIFD